MQSQYIASEKITQKKKVNPEEINEHIQIDGEIQDDE